MTPNGIVRIVSLILSVFVLVLFTTACSGGEEKANSKTKEETIVLTGVTPVNSDDYLASAFHVFAEKIEKNSDGRIKIEYKGGPETIAPMEQGEALGSGVVDFAVTPAAYYAATVPEGLALSYSELSIEEELERGSIDYLNKIHNDKLNVQLLGRGTSAKFGLFLKEKIDSVDDLKGLRLRGTPTYGPLFEKVGANLITLPSGDIFESLDKGVIDGFGWIETGITKLGLQDLAKYHVEPFYLNVDVVTIMNLDKWNSLPEDIKKIIMDTQREVEKELPAVRDQFKTEDAEKLKGAGIERIDLGEQFPDIANEAGWDFIERKLPEQNADLIKYFRK
ncbi:hypothetical protein D0469_01135 [Peribacillus saganii]|uniref:C4-dicarboxylate ABC transporter substrate-binding protein n=1 Tax=Peribacillus saganii TaxID=2303992 RepID=A0A372LV77_9BACI|nr:TRAP transporter substrate-binding protein DctP [Peribacillus saganii]RFU71474.1 hypothetical protein D0469_01135 [Peribacillus saganii]